MSTQYPNAVGDLFEGLWQAAHWIWDRRAIASRMRFPFSEETITETVLLNLKAGFPGQITVVPFNKRREGQIGADWEWCLYDLSDSRFLRMLIQAKVIDNKETAYSHLDRMVGNTGERQIDVLARVSRTRGVPAFYVFYNHLTDRSRVDLKRCRCVQNCAECWGATIAPLAPVLANLPSKTFDSLQPSMIPWACMLCPPSESLFNRTRHDTIDRALAALSELNSRATSRTFDEVEERDARVRIEENPPDYIELISGSPDLSELNLQSVKRLAKKNSDLDGVVLIDASSLARPKGEDGGIE